MEVVLLDWEEVSSNVTSESLKAKIKAAYGYDGLGILAIRNVPRFAELRGACLPLAWKLGQLPEASLAKYEHAPSYYQFGWSRGKEKLEGKPDYSKGSFYANPVFDKPSDDPELVSKYPAFYFGNIWPSETDAPVRWIRKASIVGFCIRQLVPASLRASKQLTRTSRASSPTLARTSQSTATRLSRQSCRRMLRALCTASCQHRTHTRRAFCIISP
jgi:hypothetical protein